MRGRSLDSPKLGGRLGRRPNYSYEKQQREMRKRKKKEAKLAKKSQKPVEAPRSREPQPSYIPPVDDKPSG
ncbi:MAG: hypothetical protein GKS06_06315 [Acidobacteria bacterium]|nr:hypothetical protein [Acidobacteriota bacterium]